MKQKIEKSDNDSDPKSCVNCINYNCDKNSCSHQYWHMCIIRDDDGYVIDYIYHHYN